VILNSRELPKILYGLHMCEGVAEYHETGTPTRIFVGEDVLKNMNPTFAGKPVYVNHVENVNLDTLQEEADGYVTESFFNKADGKYWAKFLVVSDRGHEAIRKGWKLSNAYRIKNSRGGGKWHNVDYQQEVADGEYTHLAIVPNPRYEESIVLTPEQFKEYNSQKDQELKELANSKGERSMFKFFKKQAVENAAEMETLSVTLSNGQEKTLKQVINELEEAMKAKAEEKKNEEMEENAPAEPMMANGDHMVAVGEEKMKVNELVEKS